MLQMANLVRQSGGKAYICAPNGRHHKTENEEGYIPIGGRISEDMHIALGRLTGLQGCFSIVATLRFLRKMNRIKPDVIHIHNLHNSYINISILFKYIKRNNIRVVWTLHDCWAFTGHCPHFTVAKCDKWKTGCHDCAEYRNYPKSCFDNSKLMYSIKKKAFTGVKDLTLVAPSKWLADMVKQSFLCEYPIIVIHNGIDLSVFKPTKSQFREKYCCQMKKILLGVSLGWRERKGLDIFIQLANHLDDNYQIAMVGTDEEIDKLLPPNVISIHRTHDKKELAEIYTVADVFVNPTREDTFPTVNIEALACGTPVVVFDVCGCAECLDETCGSVLKVDDLQTMVQEIKRICEKKPYESKDCIERAQGFEATEKYTEYLKIY